MLTRQIEVASSYTHTRRSTHVPKAVHQEASKCRQKRSQKSQKQQVERSTFVVSYLGYHTVGFHVWRLDSSRHWEKGLTGAWGNTAKSVVFEARRGVRPATLEHPFHSGVSLLLETATDDKTGWADSSEGPVCQRPRRGQGRCVGFFCASHFNSCFHSSQ